MIRKCQESDFETVLAIINESAMIYRDTIPADRWHEPYMTPDELRREIGQGVEFWKYENRKETLGVMGLQNVEDVTLIRHAYVRTDSHRHGIGSRLLEFLRGQTTKPLLVGTWTAATWAISFYQKHGFRQVSSDEKNRLLKKYWSIPERQIETSVVLTEKRT